MLPASEGDCLILSYGPDEPGLRHVLIDGGRKGTWPRLEEALRAIADAGQSVELMLLSHIDADHIDGLLKLAEVAHLPLTPKQVWYNSFDHLKALVPPGQLQPQGFRAADAYTKVLKAKGWALNEEFGGKAIFVEETPGPFDFAGLTLTLISPAKRKLSKLWIDWQKWRNGKGLQPQGSRPMPAALDVDALSKPSAKDSTAPNGSSIALIAEYDGRTVLLGADAHPDVLEATLGTLGGGAPLALDLVKLPHHGSRANVTEALIRVIDCSRFAISTSGAVFGHPDPEAISRILKFGSAANKTFYFNYRSDRTAPWDNAALKAKWNYECVFRDPQQPVLTIDI